MAAADLVQRFYNDLWNVPDLSVIPEILHEDFAFRGSLGTERKGHGEFADYVGMVTGALSNYRCDIEDLVSQDNRVVARMMFSGLHTGHFLDRSPTGRKVSWAGAAFFSCEDSLIRTLWVLGDLHTLYTQLDN
jgi:predicted ester cyclase